MKKLEGFRLDHIVQKMTCPPTCCTARATSRIRLAVPGKFDSVGSKQKALKVFTREEGGFHHCQVDNPTIAVHYMWDSISDVLNAGM